MRSFKTAFLILKCKTETKKKYIYIYTDTSRTPSAMEKCDNFILISIYDHQTSELTLVEDYSIVSAIPEYLK